MTAAQDTHVSLTMPSGVRLYDASGFAESWEVYDALPWGEREWHVDLDGHQCAPDAPGAHVHRHKETREDGCRFVVYPPHHGREDES